MRREDYDVWYDKFKPKTNPNESETILLETYGEELELVKNTPDEFVWTILEVGKSYLVPGKHFVNRYMYVICEVAWKEGQRDYLFDNNKTYK